MQNNGVDKSGIPFVTLGLMALTLSLVVGVLTAFKFLYPDALNFIPFERVRPIHVSLAVSWIFLGSIGGIYFYLPNFCNLKIYSTKLVKLHYWIFLATGLMILGSYVQGYFGGREYFEFPPVLSIPIFISWVLFGFNLYKTLRPQTKPWPVYYWMWATGALFFFLTFAESYLWQLPFFRDNMIRELTVQWKSYGALVGSWNMLVYGTAIFVMSKIGEDEKSAHSKMAFSLYFLSLTALMFGWAHHAYPVPMASSIRMIAYVISMSELLILGKIIWDWRLTLTKFQACNHRHSSRLMFWSEIWVFLNLILALIMSVPALNHFTHGTHITVAHSMGTTIGINTMILLSSVYFMIEEKCGNPFEKSFGAIVKYGRWLANGSLAIFLLALVVAGYYKGTVPYEFFQDMMDEIRPFLIGFSLAGIGVLIGLWMLLLPAIKCLVDYKKS